MKEEIWTFGDEFGNEIFIMRKDFMRFKFKTDDEFAYNQEINIPVCVMSISSVVQKVDIYYPQFKLHDCFYESELSSS